MVSLFWFEVLGIVVGVILLLVAIFAITDREKLLAGLFITFGLLLFFGCGYYFHCWNISKVGPPSTLSSSLTYKVISRTQVGQDTYLVNLQEVSSDEYYCVLSTNVLTAKDGIVKVGKSDGNGAWQLLPVSIPCEKKTHKGRLRLFCAMSDLKQSLFFYFVRFEVFS